MTFLPWPARSLALVSLLVAAALLAFGFSASRPVQAGASEQNVAHFELVANPKFVNCLTHFPGDPNRAPAADVTVQRGNLNDQHVPPGLLVQQPGRCHDGPGSTVRQAGHLRYPRAL